MFLRKKLAASAVVVGLGVASLTLVGVSSANAAPTTANLFESVSSDFSVPSLGDISIDNVTTDLDADDTGSASRGEGNSEAITGETDDSTNNDGDDTAVDEPSLAEYDSQNVTDDTTTDAKNGEESSAEKNGGAKILIGVSIFMFAFFVGFVVARHVVLARISRKH